MSDALYGGTPMRITESERFLISIALAGLVTATEDVPEVSLDEVLELHSRFLMPSDIAA
jgi:hypothetical protein